MLPMLLREGGEDHCHLENPFHSMETALVLVSAIPIIYISHRHRHSKPSQHRPRKGNFSPPNQSRMMGIEGW